MPCYSNRVEMRERNLHRGDLVYLGVKRSTLMFQPVVHSSMRVCEVHEHELGSYLSCAAGNGVIFEDLGLMEERFQIASAIQDIQLPLYDPDYAWPTYPGCSMGKLWCLVMAIYEHMEGEQDLRTYLEQPQTKEPI